MKNSHNLSTTPHQTFLEQALPKLQNDSRIVGVAIGGSWASNSLDEFSDLDFVIAVEPEHLQAVMAERMAIASELGSLLSAFTGEHVGEPRLLICLYGPPLLHVDLKFVSLPDIAIRIEDPMILWERSGRLTEMIATTSAYYPPVNLQAIEDRFWVWIHYATTKLGRGELFEVLGLLSFMRDYVFGPLIASTQGQLPRGVRRIEALAPVYATELRRTLASHDAASCAAALFASVDLYRELRSVVSKPEDFGERQDAESASVEYLEAISKRLQPDG